MSIKDSKVNVASTGEAEEAASQQNKSQLPQQSQNSSDETLSINSILKSSEDSCALLGQVLDARESKTSLEVVSPKKKSKHEPVIEQVDKPISEQHNWTHYKDLLQCKLQKA